MQELFNNFSNTSKEQEETLKRIGAVIIDDWNGKFYEYNIDFDISNYYYGICDYPCAKYEGTLDKETKLPNGFGRLIRKDKLWLADGQFKDGAFHGYVRSLKKNGDYHH